MSVFMGEVLKMSIFGESHGPAVGMTISGLPAGLPLDEEKIAAAMARRAPGKTPFSTARRETDQVEFLSGIYQGKTCGTPLAALIRNHDRKSGDYQTTLLRPGHADYSGKMRYGGFNDPRGGGHFSGRLTAPLVLAGALAESWLSRQNIVVAAHIAAIDQVEDRLFDPCRIEAKELEKLRRQAWPLLAKERERPMQEAILAAQADGDSVGGIIECAAVNLPPGWGNPLFFGVESVIASLLYSIGAVKGVEFGSGFQLARRRGSEVNDAFIIEEGQVKTATNHNGGLNGGLTNGMPLVVRAAIKPTPSIAKKQQTVDAKTGQPAELSIVGRHDPCIVPRAVAAVEAALQLALCDIGLSMKSRVLSE
ncbi:MAG: chorismate synthase [Bacillota bacterium]|jgi:chorismate synthase